jgi:hypothetical protein
MPYLELLVGKRTCRVGNTIDCAIAGPMDKTSPSEQRIVEQRHFRRGEEIMARTSASARVLPDHDEIRRWAEERGAKPARVCGTGGDGDVGMIRLDFPSYSGEESLEEISWVDWFQQI